MTGLSKIKFLSHVQLFVNPWTVAYQPPPSMGFSRQEYWSGLPLPSPGDLPDPGIKPGSPALQQTLYCLSHQGSPDWVKGCPNIWWNISGHVWEVVSRRDYEWESSSSLRAWREQKDRAKANSLSLLELRDISSPVLDINHHSRTMVLTGLSNSDHGLYHQPPPHSTLIPKTLDSGWITAHWLSWSSSL